VEASLRARTLGAAGSVAYWRDDHDATHRYYAAALVEAERCGDPKAIADATYNLGFAPYPQRPERISRFAQGVEHYARALDMYRTLGDRQGIGRAAWAAALGEVYRDDYTAARAHAEEALALARDAGDRFYEGWALWVLALLDLVNDRLETAERLLLDATRAFLAMGDHTGPVMAVFAFALIARRRGDILRHWRLRGAAERLRAATGADLVRQAYPSLAWEYDERPTDAAGWAAWNEGSALDEAAAVALAIEGIEAAREGDGPAV
jgi:hypothetical protein